MAATSLADLPPEILSKLFSFLPGKYLVTVAQTCKSFHDAVQIESVWRMRCLKEFGVSFVDKCRISPKTIFTKLLHKWGYTLGVWQTDIVHYGGLLHVQFTGSRIEGTQYLTPPDPNISEGLRPKVLFSVECDDTGEKATCCCNRGYQGAPHPAQLFKIKRADTDENCFKIKCSSADLHMHPDGRQAEFMTWYREEIGDPQLDIDSVQGHELYLMKFMVLLQYESCLSCIRISLPQQPSEAIPIQPGLFKGTYGAHGVEIVMLEYDLEKKEALVKKITGDPNVPAGQLTLKADLNRAMILTSQQQTSMLNLSEIDTPDLPPNMTLDKMPQQPFDLPADWLERSKPSRVCKYRYHSQGQIAGHGYTSPSFIPGHWIVFDENTFGHIWIDLQSLSLFSRVHEKLDQ